MINRYRKHCVWCSAVLLKFGGRRKFCNSSCYGLWRSQEIRAVRLVTPFCMGHKNFNRRKGHIITSCCIGCGKKFDNYVKASLCDKGQLPKYCSKECYFANPIRPLHFGHDRVCEICGGDFRVGKKKSTQRFCSGKCRGIWISTSGVISGRNSGRYGRSPKHPKTYLYFHNGTEIRLRSSWEVEVAAYLDAKDIRWEYETKRFALGNHSYVPDFRLIDEDCYWEVKGWFHKSAQQKIAKFRELYPEENLVVLTSAVYNQIKAYNKSCLGHEEIE